MITKMMVDHFEVNIRPMLPDDIGKCLQLSGSEGWNQTEQDWMRLVGNSRNTCRVAEHEGRIVGTATASNYENEIAWIGMVLVDKAYRGKGISKNLLNVLFTRLESCRSVKLDATPAGQPVYEKFGFKDEYLIYRMTGTPQDGFKTGGTGLQSEPVLMKDVPEVIELDCSVFGANRTPLLNSMIRDNPGEAWCIRKNGRITAFSLGRKGTRYFQAGPVFTADAGEAMILISHALSRHAGEPMVVDVLADKVDLIRWLNSAGFVSQRHFVRMYRYRNPRPGKPGNQQLICGPEFG